MTKETTNPPFQAFETLETDLLKDVTENIYESAEIDDGTEEFYSGDEPGYKPNEETKNPLNIGNILPPGVTMTALDKGSSILSAWILTEFLHLKARPKEFQLSAPERRSIEPYWTECLKTLNININNPWLAFAIVWGSIYGSKIYDIQEQKRESGEFIEKETAGSEFYQQEKKPGRGRPRKNKL